MTVTLAFKAFAKAIPCLTPFLARSDPSVLKRILAYIRGLPCSSNIFPKKVILTYMVRSSPSVYGPISKLIRGKRASGDGPKPKSLNVRFSNRPFGVKHFQAIQHSSVDVAHGLALLFGLGTRALPSWDSKTRWNNLLRDLAVEVTAGSSGHTNSPHPSSREGHHSTVGWIAGFLLFDLILSGSHVAATSLVHRNSVPSTQMRCMITASRRASATIAFSNRPSGVKHFQAIQHSSVDVAHGLALLFGLGTRALPSWDSKTRWNNLLRDLAVEVTAGSSGHTNSPHPSSREGHHSTVGWIAGFLLFDLILSGSHAAATSLVHRKSVPSTQMRCMITANRRASATIAFFIPRCLAIFIAQALSQDHFVERTSMIWAAS